MSFSCLTALANPPNKMFSRDGESSHPCLLPNLKGKDSVFTFKCDDNCRFFL